jgi:hypothetical protein
VTLAALPGVFIGDAGVARITREGTAIHLVLNGVKAELVPQAADLYSGVSSHGPIVVGAIGDSKHVDLITIRGMLFARATGEVPSEAAPADPLSVYVGSYRCPSPPISLQVSREGDAVFVQLTEFGAPAPKMPLISLGERRFGSLLGPLEFSQPTKGVSPAVTVPGVGITLGRQEELRGSSP